MCACLRIFLPQRTKLKMEFGSRRARRRKQIEVEASYPCGLQFYADPPTGDVSLVEFDEMAFERLKGKNFCYERSSTYIS